jgi:toxin HigB-1
MNGVSACDLHTCTAVVQALRFEVVIVSFGDNATRDLFDGTDLKDARSIPKQLWAVALRKVDMLNAARDLMDLKAAPSNRLEKLKGNLAGRWSIRVNDQYRVVFKFAKGNAEQVRIVDSH